MRPEGFPNIYNIVQHFTPLCFLPVSIFVSCSENEHAQTLSTSRDNKEDGSQDTTELDDKISRTLDTLQRLDASLVEYSNDPPEGGGEKMKKMVFDYNEACFELLSLCKIDKLRVLDAASDMLEPGGPKFLDIEINKAEVKKNFNWDEDNVDDFLNLTKKTYSYWKTLWSLYNNFP